MLDECDDDDKDVELLDRGIGTWKNPR